MRLIDADAAKEWFKGGRVHMFSDDVLNRIDHTPTIDAIPVVRCKDCKHLNAEYRCVNWRGLYDYTKADDFCSYGERRDTNG